MYYELIDRNRKEDTEKRELLLNMLEKEVTQKSTENIKYISV